MRWSPFSCVQSTNDFDNHVISPNGDSMSQQSFMLIYFHCYHWGMDWFYQRELYECGLLNGEHDEERVNCHIEGGAYIKDGSTLTLVHTGTVEEFDGYLQKKKKSRQHLENECLMVRKASVSSTTYLDITMDTVNEHKEPLS